VVKKLTTGGSRPSEGLSKETGLFNLFLVSQFKVKDLDLEYFLSRSPDFKETEFNLFLASPFKVKVKDLDLEYFLSRSPDFIIQGQGFGLRIFSIKVPRLHNS